MNPLFVPELFHYILDYLAPSSSGGTTNSEERKALVALAQTCSAFSNPCLDRLWWRLDSLLPLVRSFAHVVDETRVKVQLQLNRLYSALFTVLLDLPIPARVACHKPILFSYSRAYLGN